MRAKLLTLAAILGLPVLLLLVWVIPGRRDPIRTPASDNLQAAFDAKKKLRAQVYGASADPEKAGEVAKTLVAAADTDLPAYSRNYILQLASLVAGDAEVAGLSRLLRDEEVKEMALYALQRINSAVSQDAIAAHLEAATGAWAAALITALASSEDARVLSAIRSRLSDEAEEVRLAAIAALGRVPARGNVEVLRGLMSKGAKAERDTATDSYLRLAAAFESASLYRWLYEKNLNEQAQIAALAGLGAYGAEGDLGALLKALENPNADVRGAARSGLIYNNITFSIDSLTSRLPEARPAVQKELLSVLAGRQDLSAVPPVRQLAKESSDPGVRELAADVLKGPLKDRSGAPALWIHTEPVAEGIAISVKNLEPEKRRDDVRVEFGELPVGVRPGELKRTSDEERIQQLEFDDPSLLLPLWIKVIVGAQSREELLFVGEPKRRIVPNYNDLRDHGDQWATKTVAGKTVISTQTEIGWYYIYCDVADEFMYDDDATCLLTVDAVTADGGVSDFVVHYDSSDPEAAFKGTIKGAAPESVERVSEDVIRARFRLDRARFAGRQRDSADLRLAMVRRGEGELYITRLRLERVEPE